jgi:hypothetical protein
MASGDNTVEEHSTHQLKVEGLCPVSADNNRREKIEKKGKGIMASSDSTVAQHSPNQL